MKSNEISTNPNVGTSATAPSAGDLAKSSTKKMKRGAMLGSTAKRAPKTPTSSAKEIWAARAKELEKMSRAAEAKRHEAFNKNTVATLTQDLRELSTKDDMTRSKRFNGSGITLTNGKQVTTASLLEDLNAARDLLDVVADTHPELHKRFTDHIDHSQTAIKAMTSETSKHSFATKAVVAAVANLPLMALPILLGLDLAKVQDVEPGESRVSKDFLLLMAGYQAKSAALMLSHASSHLADGKTLKNGMIERQAYDVLSFIAGAPAAFNKPFYDSFGKTGGHSFVRAGLLVASLNALFQQDSLGKFGNRMVTGLQSLAITGTTQGATSFPRLERLATGLTEHQKSVLTTASHALHEVGKELQSANSVLEADSVFPSPTYSEKNGAALASIFTASDEINHISKSDDPSADTPTRETSNPDRLEKALIFALTVAVYAANLAMVREDPLSLVDVTADSGFALPLIYSAVNDPAVDATAAKNRFKSFVGTSLLATFLLGGNKLAGNPVEKNDNVFYAMLGVFAATSLTMPSPVASLCVNFLDKVVQTCCKPGEDGSVEIDPEKRDAAIEEGLELVEPRIGNGENQMSFEEMAEKVGEGFDALAPATDADDLDIPDMSQRITELGQSDTDEGGIELTSTQGAIRLGGEPIGAAGLAGAGQNTALRQEPLSDTSRIFEIAKAGRTPQQVEADRQAANDPKNIV